MATAEQVKALIRCHAEGDEDRFYAVALQVAAHEARAGHSRFAKELRELIDKARGADKSAPRLKPVPVVQPRGELAGLMSVGYPKTRLSSLVLQNHTESQLLRVLAEQRRRGELGNHGLQPIRRLLLLGPPGTGKTLTASALAGELGLPLFTVQLHSLITKYMGETAAKLRLVFDAMERTRAIYLFDEFDALGGDRSVGNDVGEIRRVLNSFLLFLEQEETDSLIIGATNHPALLDRALFRRFDVVVRYSLPDQNVAEALLKNRLSQMDTSSVDWSAATAAAEGLSHGDIVRACEQAAKDAILQGTIKIDAEQLITWLTERLAATID